MNYDITLAKSISPMGPIIVTVALVFVPKLPPSSGWRRLTENESDGRFSSAISMSAVTIPSSKDKFPSFPNVFKIFRYFFD